MYVSDSATKLNEAVLWKCEHFGKISLYPARSRLQEWFNKHTHRNISIRQIDRYIHQLKYAGWWKRWPRKKNMGSLGMIYTSAGVSIKKKGLKALEYAHHKAFDIMDKIKALRTPKKKKAPRIDDRGARSKVLTPLGESVKGLIEVIKPS